MEELLNQGLPNVYQGYINRNGTKKFKFWKHLIKKEKILIESLDKNAYVKITEDDFYTSLRDLKTALDNHCQGTGKKWCFNFYGDSCGNLVLNRITLYVPEMHVERQDGLEASHTFKNFCIKIFLKKNEGNIVFSLLDIFKPTIEEKEISYKKSNIKECNFTYHPHYQLVTYFNLTSVPNRRTITDKFCYGHGEMGQFMLSLPFKKYETIEDIEFILYSIEEFYKSESPEGGAYHSVNLMSDNRENYSVSVLHPSYYSLEQKSDLLRNEIKNLTLNGVKEFYNIVKKCDFIQNKSTFQVVSNSIEFLYTEFLTLFYSYLSEEERKKFFFFVQSSGRSEKNFSLFAYEKYLLRYDEEFNSQQKKCYKKYEVHETGTCVTIDNVTIPVNIYRKPLDSSNLPTKVEFDLNSFTFPEELFKIILKEIINEQINEEICKEYDEYLENQ